MPDIFKKNCKIKVIEYGENYKPSPFLGDMLKKLRTLFLKKAT